MRQFKVGQRVRVPNGRIGTIKSLQMNNEALIWFDTSGLDIGYFSVPTLSFVLEPVN